MNLKELYPLQSTPQTALDKVDASTLSEGAAFILLAYRTGVKPKPEQVQAVCRQDGLPDEPETFYIINNVPGYEFLYADRVQGSRRDRRLVGRIEKLAKELADAAVTLGETGAPVDLSVLASVIKPRSYKPRPPHSVSDTRRALLEAIVSLTASLGYAPTIHEVARETGHSSSTVHRHIAAFKEAGIVSHDGQRTLRLTPAAFDENGCIAPRSYDWSPPRRPPTTRDLFQPTMEAMTASLGRQPTARELAKELNVSLVTVYRYLNWLKHDS